MNREEFEKLWKIAVESNKKCNPVDGINLPVAVITENTCVFTDTYQYDSRGSENGISDGHTIYLYQNGWYIAQTSFDAILSIEPTIFCSNQKKVEEKEFSEDRIEESYDVKIRNEETKGDLDFAREQMEVD
jgi:hypothetical protein